MTGSHIMQVKTYKAYAATIRWHLIHVFYICFRIFSPIAGVRNNIEHDVAQQSPKDHSLQKLRHINVRENTIEAR